MKFLYVLISSVKQGHVMNNRPVNNRYPINGSLITKPPPPSSIMQHKHPSPNTLTPITVPPEYTLNRNQLTPDLHSQTHTCTHSLTLVHTQVQTWTQKHTILTIPYTIPYRHAPTKHTATKKHIGERITKTHTHEHKGTHTHTHGLTPNPFRVSELG